MTTALAADAVACLSVSARTREFAKEHLRISRAGVIGNAACRRRHNHTDDGVTYTNVLSSVINFTIFAAGEIKARTDGTEGYYFAGADLPSGDRIAKFINDSATAIAPTSPINLVQTMGNTVITGGAEQFTGQPCRTLFIMFSYDEPIMEKIFSDNLGNNNIYVEYSEGNLIDLPFKCDFTISFEKITG